MYLLRQWDTESKLTGVFIVCSNRPNLKNNDAYIYILTNKGATIDRPLFGSETVSGQIQIFVPEIHTRVLKTCKNYMNDTCSVATIIMKVQ